MNLRSEDIKKDNLITPPFLFPFLFLDGTNGFDSLC